jgi:hypothetical protein
MRTARKKPTAAKLRSWRVIIIRSCGEYLGSVEAPDRKRAEAVAVKQFDLDPRLSLECDLGYPTSTKMENCL